MSGTDGDIPSKFPSKKNENGCSFKNFGTKVQRKKQLGSDILATPLKRCLSTFDICLLGIGHMIGAGIYVLTGEVAKTVAGPSIIVSYLIAGVTSFLAALCYAEFGSRVPKAGSAYVYTYVTIGEVWAFIIGWDVILEQMIGAASVARSWSSYLDGLLNGAIKNGTETYIGKFNVSFLGGYPDFVACGIIFLVCILLIVGVEGSTRVNSILTTGNIIVIIAIVCAGIYYADGSNWRNLPNGFFAFGFNGVMAGAAKCFFAFVGFDSIATSGEEAKSPAKSIPIATFVSMLVATLAYVAMSTILTLLVRYDHINVASAFPDAFNGHNADWAYYFVSVGAIAGMSTSMFGSLFALPRCVYAMASDGLLFKFLSRVHPRTQTPIYTLITCSLLTALIALIFSVEILVEFMSIGTLMAYTMVSASVIILRYRPVHKMKTANDLIVDTGGQLKDRFSSSIFQRLNDFKPGVVPATATVILSSVLTCICLILQFAVSELLNGSWWVIILLILLVLLLTGNFFILFIHEQSSYRLSFQVPWVPLIPSCSIFCNVYLMTSLDAYAWIRFAVWMVIGMSIYFFYGMHHSKNDVVEATASLSHSPTVDMGSPMETLPYSSQIELVESKSQDSKL